MNPQFTADEVAQQYVSRDVKQLVTLYATVAASASIRQQWQERLANLERLAGSPGRLLDFGCGYGGFLEEAQLSGWDAHGLELGEWAGSAAAARGLRNLHVGWLADQAFEAESFDVIHTSQVLEHLASPLEQLLQLRPLLKPGGILYADVPNYRSLTIRLGKDDFMLNEPPQHVNYFSPRTLRSLLVRAGLEVIEVTTSGGLKWENLLGRPIKSEIADAYGFGGPPGKPATPPQHTNPAPPAATRVMKRIVVTALVKPILYNRLHLGMGLAALAKRP